MMLTFVNMAVLTEAMITAALEAHKPLTEVDDMR
jgi:hypothetical protein